MSSLKTGEGVSELQTVHMERIMLRWTRDNPFQEETQTMTHKINKLENQMKIIMQKIEWFGFQTTFARNKRDFLSMIESLDKMFPLGVYMVSICFFVGAALIPLTFGLSMLIPLATASVFLSAHLRPLVIQRMARSSIDYAKSRSVVKAFVHRCFQSPYTEKIKTLKEDCECTIRFIHQTIEKMEKDAQNKRNLSSILHEFQNKIKEFLRRLQYISILYFDQNIVLTEHLRIGKVLSTTDVFHLHIVENEFGGKQITLRVLDSSFSAFYLKEIDNIRAMKHENFVSHLAIAFSTSSLNELPDSDGNCGCNDNSLKVLIEPSTEDLETFIIGNKKIGCVVGENARATFVHISSGISNGLAYIHSKEFVHGQLQLSAVLLCGTAMVPKLCDVNVLPYYKDRNHEKCIYHTAPEVIKDGTYGPEADVYSYGILLWELWYGRHTKRSEASSELSVCCGERPMFEDIRPPKFVETLIAMCWNGDKDKRPTAKEVCECLLKLK
ncbi:hypothetical protein ACJMK2_036971 [Sinanodonta woodiana]|uniref:Protein kinase domain-containing protein n=1 Tax=Sinanodonta woodiana TaxID=1069815 RepID=A0ABD3WMC1_SINWO